MRGRKWSWSEKILFLTPFLFVLMAMATFLVPRDRVFRADVWAQSFQFGSRGIYCGPTCSSNLKQIGLAFAQYSQDYSDTLPPAAVGAGLGWVDAAQPYLKSWQIFRCPQNSSSAPATGMSDYFLNSAFSALPVKNRNTFFNSILAGEGNDRRDLNDTRYNKSALPQAWITHLRSPAHRHLTYEVWATGKANYLFGDGHVKALAPAEIDSDKYTFQPQ